MYWFFDDMVNIQYLDLNKIKIHWTRTEQDNYDDKYMKIKFN